MTKKLHVYLTDAEIIAGIREGGHAENKAIETIYEQNKSIILGFLAQRTNTEYAKDPEDILWEAMEALVLNIRNERYNVQDGVGLTSYFKSICKNLLLKAIDSEHSRVNRQSIYAGFEDETTPDVSQEMIEKETWNGYIELFEQAGKNCQRILEMSFADGMKVNEVAQELIKEGLYDNEQVVRNAKSKCLKRMKEMMA
jgi:RNA polymerase sigma factor (sigma-70 family)